MHRTALVAMLLTVILGCSAAPQSTPAFEVASVKPNQQGELAGFSFSFAADGGLTARNDSVWNLIRAPYGVRDLQISGGPSWIKTQGFDIEAKPPKSDQFPASRHL